jgi:hypothetical protein
MCPGYEDVEHTLLAIGGKSVMIAYSVQWTNIRDNGRLFDNEVIDYPMSLTGICYDRACQYFIQFPESRICVGYGLLNSSQTWEAHSWILNNNIIYNSNKMDAFWGVELSYVECLDFAISFYYLKKDYPYANYKSAPTCIK